MRGQARQTLEADVEEDALLVAAPDALVPFAGSNYDQRASIRLAKDASLAWVDVRSCGRASRGERWAMSRYASRTRVHREGALVCDDALVPRIRAARSPARDGTIRCDREAAPVLDLLAAAHDRLDAKMFVS